MSTRTIILYNTPLREQRLYVLFWQHIILVYSPCAPCDQVASWQSGVVIEQRAEFSIFCYFKFCRFLLKNEGGKSLILEAYWGWGRCQQPDLSLSIGKSPTLHISSWYHKNKLAALYFEKSSTGCFAFFNQFLVVGFERQPLDERCRCRQEIRQ